jgi:TPR repeat protein
MAAVKGCPDAEYTLGRMYLNGVGVEENKEEGLKLIRDAGEQGIREAKALLIELSEDSAHLQEK